MFKKKKMLALLLALAMTLALAACGGGDAPADSAPPAESEPAQSGAETAPEEEDETPEVTAIPLQLGGSIDNDRFLMTFDSLELLPEYEYSTSEYSSTSLYVEEGYQLVVVKGHFENRGTSAISDSAFSLSAVVNDTYEVDGHDVRFNFIRDKYFEIDAYTDLDYVLYINIPNKLADMFETATFSIGFNDDLSSPTTVWSNDGESYVEVDQMYALTSGVAAAGGGDGGDADPAAASTLGLWSVNYYVDDFQQPTEDWYITTNTQFSGTFSNSATTNSNLLAQVAYDYQDNITIFLWEYGRSQVKNSSSNYVDEYDITMRDQNGADQKLSGTVYCGGDRVVIEGADKDQVVTAMKQPGTVSFHIVESDRTTTSYLFSIETDNFASVYDAQMGTQTV